MELKDFVGILPADVASAGNVAITGVSSDSREVKPGTLFVAVPGTKTDGAAYAAEAERRGAVAIVATRGAVKAPLSIPVIEVDDPRRAIALCAARFFPRQPDVMVAVTGTSGKTSVAAFVRQIWEHEGLAAASIGTTGVVAPGRNEYGSLTTPDPVALHRLLDELAREGVTHGSMEASSHGLDQRRLDGLRIEAAAFTNLARDHYDYHGDAAAYFAAKRRLFDTLLEPGRVAVLNADVPERTALAEVASARRLRVIDYGREAEALRLLHVAPAGSGQEIEILALGHRHRFTSPLVGSFQAHNLLAALGLAIGCGEEVEALLPHLAGLQAPPGRMQLAAHHPSGAPAFVDYSHKPEALEQALRSLRPHTAGRLVLVFGCGGDRDPGKRPLMGAIAVRNADRVYVTDDNPRTEDPAAIRAAILAAAPGAVEVGEREEAIRRAFAELRAGDALLVAGKGHETYQIIGERTLPFDDAEVLRRCAAESGGRAA